MPLTKSQAKFVKNHIHAQLKWDAERRNERDAELAALRETSAKADKQEIAKARSELEAFLIGTGRAPDPTIADPDAVQEQQAARKEAHLQEVILRDEDGLNVGQIVDAIAPPPDPKVRQLALQAVTKDTPPRERAEIEAARAILRTYEGKRKAADQTVETELKLLVGFHMSQGRSDRVAKNAAMHAVAEHFGQHSLSHHASRHGAHTSDEEQVRRVATGYAPDDMPPAVPVEALTTRTGENVIMPLVSEQGPHSSNVASRFASAEIALHMIEELMADVQAVRARGEIETGDAIKREIAIDPSGEIIGDQAVPFKLGNNYQSVPRPNFGAPGMTVGGSQLTSSKHLTGNGKTQDEKDEIVRDRVASVGIEANVRGATLIMRGLPDGSFRMVTAYPNAEVTSSATRNESRDMPISRLGADDRTELPSVAERQLEKANQTFADSKGMAKTAATVRDQASSAALQAFVESQDAILAAGEGAAREACTRLQSCARDWTQADMAARALRARHQDAVVAQQRVGKEIGGRGSHVNALEVARNTCQIALTGSPGDKGLERDLRLAEEALQEAQTALDFAHSVNAGLTAQTATFGAKADDAEAKRDQLGVVMNDALVDSKASAGDDIAKSVKDKAIITASSMVVYADKKLAANDAGTAVAQARLAKSLAEEALAHRNDNPPLSAEDRLGAAVAEGGTAFDAARQQWAEDIAALEMLLEVDRSEREKATIALAAERDTVREQEIRAQKDLDATIENLSRLASASQRAMSPELQKAISDASAAEKVFERISTTRRQLTATVRDQRAQQRNQAILDETNIALAKARLEAKAERMLFDEGASNALEESQVKRLEAEEMMCAKRTAFRMAVDAARLAKSAAEMAAEELQAATDTLDRMVARGLDMTDTTAKATVNKVDALTHLRDETEDARVAAEIAKEAAQVDMNAAEKAARKHA